MIICEFWVMWCLDYLRRRSSSLNWSWSPRKHNADSSRATISIGCRIQSKWLRCQYFGNKSAKKVSESTLIIQLPSLTMPVFFSDRTFSPGSNKSQPWTWRSFILESLVTRSYKKKNARGIKNTTHRNVETEGVRNLLLSLQWDWSLGEK